MSKNAGKESVGELEIKLTNCKVTKVRTDILKDIKNGYLTDISSKYDPLISEQSAIISGYKIPNQKGDVEKIVAAIKNAAEDKYELVYEVVCKIADGNNLHFELEPRYDKIPVVAAAKKLRDKLILDKKNAQHKLVEWQRKQLYNVANGKDFEVFEVK